MSVDFLIKIEHLEKKPHQSWLEGEKNWRKTLEARCKPTTNSNHIGHHARIELRAHWWKASGLITPAPQKEKSVLGLQYVHLYLAHKLGTKFRGTVIKEYKPVNLSSFVYSFVCYLVCLPVYSW